MYNPTTRVLSVLELLQSHSMLTGTELASRLEVDVRTVRRYIGMLEELGVPVTADRGRIGGYRLVAGYKLPPLMLSDDEALALTLGLLAARRLGLAAHAPGVEGALAKIERVLPNHVRERVRSVEETLIWDIGEPDLHRPDPGIVMALSGAARDRRRVTLSYRSTTGEATRPLFDPYGLVCRRGRWYAIGNCHLRGGQRLFRVDRVAEVAVCEDRFERPLAFDVLRAVQTSLGSVPRSLAVEVELDTDLETARRHISAEVATLEEMPSGGLVLRGYTDAPDWMARLLARIGCRLTVLQPPELRDALRRHAEEILSWAAVGDV